MRILTHTHKNRLLGGLGLLALALPALALTPIDGDDEQADKKADEETAEDSEPTEEWFAVSGGDVYTGTGSVLRGATILSKDGKIVDIGYDLWMPEDTETLDASGYRIYPGLVAVNSFGLFGGSSDLPNSFNPYGQNLVLALAAGVTSARTSDEVGKLKYGELEGVQLKAGVFHYLTYSKSSPSGKRKLREGFEGAAKYLRGYAEYEVKKKKDKKLKEPSKKGVDMGAVAVLKGEYRPVFRASARTDLLEIAHLAQRFGFRPIIEGCREGWTVADELGRAGASAIITPRDRRSKNESFVREGGSSIENAAILHASGVSVSIIPASPGISLGGIVGRDLMHLTTEAGFAVRGGLPEQAAIAGLTIEPARLMGIDHRVGSLEVGKDADFIICDGDLLHYQTFVQWAVVDGKVSYDKEAQLYFAHIRPRPEAILAPEDRLDAGENEPEEAVEEAAQEGDEGGDDGDDGDGDDGH
jgi:Amidohydrolase family